MSATEQAFAPAAAAPGIIRVRVPPRSWRSELRAMRIVWRRELIRFRSDRIRIVTALGGAGRCRRCSRSRSCSPWGW